MQEKQIERVMHHITENVDLTAASKGPASHWASLPLCVIDSVWSIRANYYTHVVPLIDRFCRSQGWKQDTPSTPSTPTADVSPSVRDFISVIESRLAKGATYAELFGNRQRTSARSGILKAEAVHRFAEALSVSGIDNFSDLRDKSRVQMAEWRVKDIPGQGSGLTFTYFLMLAGAEDFVKSDTQIRRFVSDALAVDWKNLVSDEVAGGLVREAAKRFATDYEELTPKRLDYAIWRYQRERSQPSPSDAGR